MSGRHDHVIDTLSAWGCERVRLEHPGGKHPRIAFIYAGKEHSFVCPFSPSDNARAWKNCLAMIRREAGIEVVRRKSNRPRKDRVRVDHADIPTLTAGSDGLAALAVHPLARKDA